MGEAADCCTTHLIERDGTFNVDGLDKFIKQVKLGECGLSYVIAAVMGPQSSGKSTLLNHLFRTKFIEMDPYKGRSQTTEGVWIARCTDIEPCTIVMDLEGTDGRERGEDDTAFEKQSALFAIAVSDIMLINIWCHDIGREHAAMKPLLKIVFQVMLQLSCCSRKKTFMFVIRDKTKTPLDKLENDLRKDIEKIWDSVPKAEIHKHIQLRDFFNVEVVALSSYEDKEEQFKEQVASLRQRFCKSIPSCGVAGVREGIIPASGFSFSTQQLWKVIKENKDLDLPAHKVMVAAVRCEEIANEKYSFFEKNEDWLKLKEAVQSHLVPAFGKKLSSLLYSCLSSYDKETTYFEDSVRSAKRKQLEEKLLQLVQPATKLILKRIRSETLDNFKGEFKNALKEGQGFAEAARDCTKKSMRLFDEKCEDTTIMQVNQGSSKIRDKLSRDVDLHITEVRAVKLREVTNQFKTSFEQALCSQVEAHLKEANDNTWPAIKELFNSETRTVISDFSSALSSFEIDEQENKDMISELKNYGKSLVEGMAKKEAGRVAYLMKERFLLIFCHHNDLTPRDWTETHDIPAIAETAQSSCLKLLSVLAAIRLDGDAGNIWHTLKKGTTTSPHLLARSTWEKFPAAKTLLTPSECKSSWDGFKMHTDYIITRAISVQKGNKRKKNKKRQVWKSTAAVACKVASSKRVVSTVWMVGAVSIATVTTGGNAVVVAAVGAGAAGVVVGVVVAGATVGFVAHKAMAYVKNSIWSAPLTQVE